ncbi:copper homeostasis protein CutC [Xenophilus sp. AP218F]|nr:copper homeostasis protein CutC [Xenophilus sp. AP218F]
MNDSIALEVCVATLASCLAAEAGGARRVELCDNLIEGGTTPSWGMIALARERLGIALHVIIRPRGGDFFYSDDEFEIMRRDVLACRQLGVDGVALGLLTADGEVDLPRTRQLVELAGGMAVTFHRAFDVARDASRALEDVIASGCGRLLTSGQAANALAGAETIRRLREQAGERLILMPGAGVRADNIAALRRATGCREFHSSAREAVASAMRFRHPEVSMGAPGQDEYARLETSAERVRQLLRNAGGEAAR